MLERRYYTRTSVYIQKINGQEWIRQIKDKESRIKDVVYISQEKFQELSNSYVFLVRDDEFFNPELKENFVREAKKEEFKDIGGMIIYFVPEGLEYRIMHSGVVQKIEEV